MPAYFTLRSGQRDGHDQLGRTLVEKINGDDQRRPGPGLFMADGGIETEVPDVTAQRLGSAHFSSIPSDKVCSQSDRSFNAFLHAFRFRFSAA